MNLVHGYMEIVGAVDPYQMSPALVKNTINQLIGYENKLKAAIARQPADPNSLTKIVGMITSSKGYQATVQAERDGSINFDLLSAKKSLDSQISKALSLLSTDDPEAENAPVDTGVFSSLAGPALLWLIGGGALVTLILLKRRRRV